MSILEISSKFNDFKVLTGFNFCGLYQLLNNLLKHVKFLQHKVRVFEDRPTPLEIYAHFQNKNQSF